MTEYWLARQGQKHGPYSMDELRRMNAEGSTTPADIVWTAGMTNWQPLASVIRPPASAAPPPPPPPPLSQPSIQSYPVPPMVPPSLHWGVVLLLSVCTFGLFSWIWCLREAGFVKKLNQGSSSLLLMIFAIVGQVGANFFSLAALGTANEEERLAFLAIQTGIFVVSAIFFIVGAFQMRRALVNYYNSVEPIGLRLSGAMTFFFSTLYLQHHLSRIARWKQTGLLAPQ